MRFCYLSPLFVEIYKNSHKYSVKRKERSTQKLSYVRIFLISHVLFPRMSHWISRFSQPCVVVVDRRQYTWNVFPQSALRFMYSWGFNSWSFNSWDVKLAVWCSHCGAPSTSPPNHMEICWNTECVKTHDSTKYYNNSRKGTTKKSLNQHASSKKRQKKE